MSLQQRYSPHHNNNDTIDDNNIILVDVKEEVLPLKMSLEQYYSPFLNNNFHNNNDLIDDISNTQENGVCKEPYNSIRSTHFNSPVDDRGVDHSDISINDEVEYQHDIRINNKENRPIYRGGE